MMSIISRSTAAQHIITIGREAYNKHLVAGRAGNLSIRLDNKRFMITGQGASLGFLQTDRLVVADFNGVKRSGTGNLSFETGLHAAIYKNSAAGAIVHVHPRFTLTLMDAGYSFRPHTFESALFLGTVPVVPQQAPNVSDTAAVVAALALNNIVVLENHGVVSVGETIWDGFFLAELLEETAQMNIFSSLLQKGERKKKHGVPSGRRKTNTVKLFSKGHLSQLQQAIHNQALKNFAPKAFLSIGMKQHDRGIVTMLVFKNGTLADIRTDKKAGDFIISGTTKAWCSVFNGLMDPFTAIIQKKMELAGSLRELLQWYPMLRPLFDVWQTIPVTA